MAAGHPIEAITALEALRRIADVLHSHAADDPAVYGKIQVILLCFMNGPDNVP